MEELVEFILTTIKSLITHPGMWIFIVVTAIAAGTYSKKK